MLHHWVGTVLIPGVTMDRVMAFVKNYADYPKHFGPMVKSARVLKEAPDRFDVLDAKRRVERLSGDDLPDAAFHLERADRRDHHRGGRLEPAVPALDV